MCGIVGAAAQRDVTAILLEGLKRLEYRGYDSAGVAILETSGNPISRLRRLGKVDLLEKALKETPVAGRLGIAHTRWATHGSPSENNAHPHMSGNDIAVVHNGIIENFSALKKELETSGYTFSSETDTEVIAHLVHQYMSNGDDFLTAVRNMTKKLVGAFALGIINNNEPNRLIAVRSGSPLVIGVGINEHFIASDQLALLPVTRKFIHLEEGDIAEICNDTVTIYDAKNKTVTRNIHTTDSKHDAVDRGKYRHFMQKEIFEQPHAINETLEGRLHDGRILEQAFGTKAEAIFNDIQRVQIVACGTSYHAAMVGRYWLESLAGVPCQVEVASEIRYRKAVVQPNTLFVTLSQSGETADTLAALRQAKTLGYHSTLCICNVPESSIVRESELAFMTRAGAEIGVASTKAFTTQLVAIMMLTISLGRRHAMTKELEKKLVTQLQSVPKYFEQVLTLDATIKKLSEHFAEKDHTLFLGRGTQYPIAMEGALKLKEISYIHAEAYPAGELKHGPLALVDKDMPVVAVAPNDELLEKLKSNLHEVRARGGELIVFTDDVANLEAADSVYVLKMPAIEKEIAPIVYTVPLQLLAYHVAVLRGTDVDQPRNLAKSVTVE